MTLLGLAVPNLCALSNLRLRGFTLPDTRKANHVDQSRQKDLTSRYSFGEVPDGTYLGHALSEEKAKCSRVSSIGHSSKMVDAWPCTRIRAPEIRLAWLLPVPLGYTPEPDAHTIDAGQPPGRLGHSWMQGETPLSAPTRLLDLTAGQTAARSALARFMRLLLKRQSQSSQSNTAVPSLSVDHAKARTSTFVVDIHLRSWSHPHRSPSKHTSCSVADSGGSDGGERE